MNIILDTNILIAALIRDAHIRKLIILSPFPLFFPEIMLQEIREHKKIILKKNGMNEKSYEHFLNTLLNYLTLIPDEQLKKHLPEATTVMKNVDIKDAPFIAAALCYIDMVIWSDDTDFKRQHRILIYTTKEITHLFEQNI